jgi:hypothetical protein
VDLLPGIDGVDFDEAWSRRVEGVIDAESGQRAFSYPAPTLLHRNWQRDERAI